MSGYVVTGGAGFIGSHIVEELVRRKKPVKVIDNFSTGKRGNLEAFSGNAEIVDCDLADARGLTELLKGADYVIHQAAIPSVPKSIIDPVKSHQANVNGTLQLLMACRDAGVKRVVYASSSSLYGDSPTLPKNETMMPKPLSPYGAQKLFAETYCPWVWLGISATVSVWFFSPYNSPTTLNSASAELIFTVARPRESGSLNVE